MDRHIAAGRGGKPAVIAEAEDGTVRTLTYAELAAEINRLANALKRLGIRPGDTVGIFLPMCAEAVIATLAVARIGAVYTPCFSGYGAQAVASRLDGCGARLLITADAFARRGQAIPLKRTADDAVSASPTVEHVIVYRRGDGDVPWKDGRDLWWHELVAKESTECPALPVEADHPCLIIYTSGTTGRPKGTVLTHGGFSIKNAHDFAYLFDLGESDRLFWVTDLGWLMGPMLIGGALLTGGTAVLFEGTPDYPKPDRLWSVLERHRVTRARHLAHRGARAHAPRRRVGHAPRPLLAQADRLDRRAVEPRALSLALRDGGEGQAADHQLHGRHRDLGRHPLVLPDRADQALLVRGADSRAWPPTSTTRTAGRCAGRWASWSSRGRGRG